MVGALDVANSILKRAFEENIDVSPMKLQKLLYFTYRDYLRETGRILFNERFETWKYGPVVRCVYDAFKHYGSNSIREYYMNANKSYSLVKETPLFKRILDNVWMRYGNYSGIYLSSLTHKDGTAWSKAYEKKYGCLMDEDIYNEVVDYG